jgi:hypothetical protein
MHLAIDLNLSAVKERKIGKGQVDDSVEFVNILV